MKVGDNSLRCDYCNTIIKDDFVYYSFDFYLVDVINNVKNFSTDTVLSVDFDEECMILYRERIKLAYAPPKTGMFRCDISGEAFGASNFKYYYCKVSKVAVSLTDQPYMCNTCNKAVDIKKVPCDKCTSETVVNRIAQVDVDNRYLELNFSETMFEKFQDHINFVKDRGDLQWTTT